ncbi:MAG: hypothetical protein EOO04_29840 [Chitinophagaceae bacterium]|nr:MAG: hypothetical protein EOO04_29840 [Chitinophagaceae bacterium]
MDEKIFNQNTDNLTFILLSGKMVALSFDEFAVGYFAESVEELDSNQGLTLYELAHLIHAAALACARKTNVDPGISFEQVYEGLLAYKKTKDGQTEIERIAKCLMNTAAFRNLLKLFEQGGSIVNSRK